MWRWSVEKPQEFWPAVWRFCGLKAGKKWDAVMEPAEGVRQVRWFPGATLNFAENLLRHRDNEPAILAWNEQGHRRELSHRQLAEEVSRMAIALRTLGVGPGDRVAAGCRTCRRLSLRCWRRPASAQSGPLAPPTSVCRECWIASRRSHRKYCSPADGVRYNGKPVETLERLEQIVAGLPSVRQTIVVPIGDRHPTLRHIPRCLRWEDAIVFYPASPIRFEELPFEHPLYILFSSGTTGLPKCMVHGAGNTLLQHLKEHVLHTDIRPTDRVFYHTTCGWMMWNWLVSALATGAAIVLWDGSPMHPHPQVLWEMADEEQVTVFGTSAKYLALLEKHGHCPGRRYPLHSLRTLLSTGSPLLPASFDFVYREIKPDVHLASISGGTDIVSCFALGNPIAPVYRGQLQTRGLGMNVSVWNEAGQERVGEPGELVCRPPFPSMPLGFWNDPDESQYRAAYFSRFPGVWRHGDWAVLTPEGGLVITGRSDATLNPGGVRIGTAEIYRQVEQAEEVLESLVVGCEKDGDTEIVLFVRLQDGVELDEDLQQRLRQRIRTGASPHHVPRHIVRVPDLPRTISGKITELAVRDLLAGKEPKNLSAMANPEALEYFRRLAAELSSRWTRRPSIR